MHPTALYGRLVDATTAAPTSSGLGRPENALQCCQTDQMLPGTEPFPRNGTPSDLSVSGHRDSYNALVSKGLWETISNFISGRHSEVAVTTMGDEMKVLAQQE